MNTIAATHLKIGLILFALLSLCSAANAHAQGAAQQEAIKFMKKDAWEDAHKVLVKELERLDARDRQQQPPLFGWFWYHRGYCEIKLEKFEEAMESFEICYTKFKNVPPGGGQVPGPNPYHKKALLMWGHAAKSAEEWVTSIRMYQKFLAERDPTRDNYEQGILYINIAINHYKLNKIIEGNQYLEIAIKEKATFPTPNRGIIAAFNALIAAAIQKQDESVLLDFLSKNRSHLVLAPFEAHEFSLSFLKFARDAQAAGMSRVAFAFYKLIPDTTAVLSDLKDRLSILGTFDRTIRDGSMIVKRTDLRSSLAALEKTLDSGVSTDVYVLLDLARLHEEEGNIRGAFAAFEQLVRFFPDGRVMRNGRPSSNRENNLYDLANCHYALGENQAGLAKLVRIEKDFPNSPLTEQLLALKGNILEDLQRVKEAEQCYKEALFQAEQKKNDLVAGECLFYLTALLGKEPADEKITPRFAEAAVYYHHFWKHYGNESPFSAKVAVAGIPALRSAGKINLALERLQSVIAHISRTPDSFGLEEAIGSYTDEYLKDHSAAELAKHFFSFPGHNFSNKTAPALFRMAIISAYESETENHALKNGPDAEAIINVIYEELSRDFRPKDLPNFVLVKVGDFVRTSSKHPENAEVYYQELLNRTHEPSHRSVALLGLSNIKAKGDKTQKNEALQLLQKIINDSNNSAAKEEALYLTSSLHSENGNHEIALKSALAYLENLKFRRYRQATQMILAKAYQAAGRVDDAIIAYRTIWSSSNLNPNSTSAMHQYLSLLWQRNHTHPDGLSDRQGAYETGAKYLMMTKLAVEKASPDEKASWQKLAALVATYEASPDTVKLDE